MKVKAINYHQEWSTQLVEQYRKAWNGQLVVNEFFSIFTSSFVFHYHNKTIKGLENYGKFVGIAKQTTENLDLVPLKILANENMVLLYFQWSSEKWHDDIKGANKLSNFCKVVFRIENGKIAEQWEQAPDFMYLLGKKLSDTCISYPKVLSMNVFEEKDGGLYSTQDKDINFMKAVFGKLNDCIFGSAPIRGITEVLHTDVQYQRGSLQGEGIIEIKAFSYALKAAFGKEVPSLFEDMYIKEGNRLTVISRWKFNNPSSVILPITNGIVAFFEFEMKGNKIQRLQTHLENYLSFLDTDFNRHESRIKSLLQGKHVPVLQSKKSENIVTSIPIPEEKEKMIGLHKEEKVVIVGIAGKFPKCDTVDEYWNMLVENKSAFSEVSAERPFLDPHKRAQNNYAGLIDNVDLFDAAFFNIPPVEVEYMDPQQRLLMEVIWHSMEDSMHTSDAYSGKRTGIFVSTLSGDYSKLLQDHHVSNYGFYWRGNESSIFPAKIARFFDIQGPCKFVNTECSSGLYAIHEASQLIRSGEIDQAIVGGTNLFLHHYGFSVREDTLLSKEKQSYIFSEKSQGQLRGEAVVSVILKSLSKAIEDNDKIYGIVEGSAINNSGKTFSIIAPDIEKQAEVIKDAWNDASIKQSDISLIECHASGGREGDFAEIKAIKNAYKNAVKPSEKNPKLKISAVKGAIGHAEAASGLTVLVKLLLQLKHKIIPGVKGIEAVDSNLGITEGNLNLIDQNTKWDSSYENGMQQPRIAGMNAFAAGGYNAHVVIKEYIEKEKSNKEKIHFNNVPLIFPLSAKNKKSLKAVVQNLLTFLEDKENIEDLHNVAYTLQVAKDVMEERWIVNAENKGDLIKQLTNYLKGQTNELFAKIDKNKLSNVPLERIAEALQNREQEFLAQVWLIGMTIDWNKMYSDQRPHKVNTPQYPFLGKKYWIPDTENEIVEDSTSPMHPLLHYNISTLKEQKYTSVFTGKESFLKDHKVKTNMILPGVAYLELAREAASIGLQETITQLKNITWLSPIQVNDEKAEIGVRLIDQGGYLDYDIYSGFSEKEVLHGQGKLSTLKLPRIDDFNIDKLLSDLNQEKTGSDCYTIFKNLGLDYGKSFQGIEKLYYSNESALSRISLSKEEGYLLQPGLLDSALQTCIGFNISKSKSSLSLPFSVKEVNIHGDVRDASWCYVRKNANSSDKIAKYDINMLSDSGVVLLSFIGFTSLPIPSSKKPDKVNSQKEGLQLYSQIWSECSIVESDVVSSESNSLILLAGGSVVLVDTLRESLEEEVIAINEDTEIEYYHKIQEIVQSVLKSKQATNITVVYSTSDYVDYGFISGLLKTVEIESSKVTCKTIGVVNLSLQELDSLVEIIKSEEKTSEKEIRYVENIREVHTVSTLLAKDSTQAIGVKEGGVYLISGGTGGLGKIFASHLNETKDTRLILTGRSQKGSLSQKELASINAIYHSCDLTDKLAVDSLIESIKKSYGKLDGILHCAGVVKDSLLFFKTKEESTKVLSPKILGTKYLDEATRDLDLDFMVYFSSMSGVTGNVGQGDYSSANAWMDNYAGYRNSLKDQGKRRGHTLSINWPLWKDGGMQIDAESVKYLKQKLGMLPLPKIEGLNAFDRLLGSSIENGVVAYGNSNKISEKLLNVPQSNMAITKNNDENLVSSNGTIQADIENRLILLISDLLKLDKEDFELDNDFSDYGVDSIMMMNILNVIEDSFGIIVDPTAIVSYPTISLLAGYIQNDTDYVSQNQSYDKILTQVSSKDKVLPKVSKGHQVKTRVEPSFKEERIAIIGMSCCLPESDTIEEFWDNLKGGKDLISDIPENRWNALDHYSETKQENKAYTTKGGFIKNAGAFDAPYFGISDVDAISMDPQQRIILELSRSLFAHAGYKKEEVHNSNTAVYIGAKDNNYVRNNYHLLPEGAHQHTIVNNISNMIAARVSDFYNLKGTSQIIDTACSSSLVAIHQACEDILQGKTNMAIAGGISILVDAFYHIGFSQAGVLSKDGKSYVFDEKAQGFVMGEGGGLVLLKSYEQAKIDGDQIYGVIRGSAVNNDGKTMGLTVPNIEGQKEAIEQVFSKTNIDPKDITYYEAHGTGTLLGDPIEVKAAKEVYQSQTSEKDKRQYCAIGSVKSNLGHTMTAAGVSGLIKILLQLEHKTLVPTLHCEKPHPRFKFEESPFFVNRDLKPWDINGNANRKAAISSFGFGGTNCHMIIEEDDNESAITRHVLPVERISNNQYWLGEEMVLEDIESVILKEDITTGRLAHQTYTYNDPIMKDHLIFGNQVLMGVAHLSLGIEGTRSVFPNSDFHLEKTMFSNPMILKEGETGVQECLLTSDQEAVEVHYEINGSKKLAAKSVISKHDFEHKTIDLEAIISKAEKKIKGTDYYNLPQQECYSESTQTVKDLWYLSDGTVLASLQLNSEYHEKAPDFLIHPVILDGAHVATSLSLDKNPEKGLENHRVPLMVKRVKVFAKAENYNYWDYYVMIRRKQFNSKVSEFDMELYTDQYELIAVLEGFMTIATSVESLLGDTKKK